jgi:hypothetical protein
MVEIIVWIMGNIRVSWPMEDWLFARRSFFRGSAFGCLIVGMSLIVCIILPFFQGGGGARWQNMVEIEHTRRCRKHNEMYRGERNRKHLLNFSLQNLDCIAILLLCFR